MARVTYVKKAQQRFATTVVKDDNGEPKKVPVMRNGVQRTTKSGRLIFRTVTIEDRTKPKPNYKCENCGTEIKVGMPYKHISPKSGPYGGHKRIRCTDCPTWQPWDISSSLSARTAQISYDFSNLVSSAESTEDVTSALQEAAEAVREIAEEKRESAQNIEDGFGHSTSMSEELAAAAEQLDSWAEEIENTDVPEFPEPEEIECEDCQGSGKATPESGDDELEDCEQCGGEGNYTPEEPTDDQIGEWQQEVLDNTSIVDECPV